MEALGELLAHCWLVTFSKSFQNLVGITILHTSPISCSISCSVVCSLNLLSFSYLRPPRLLVIDGLDLLKKEQPGARDGIRYLEAEFKKGNR